MARIRTIKPSFFKSDDVSVLPMRARLTWIGLWTQCDDQGRTKDHLRLIKADVWPLDNVSLADIEEDLSTLAAHGRIVRYEVDGQRFLEVTNWSEHQKINRPTPSKIPPPPEPSESHAPLSESTGSPHDRKGRERKGREGSARETAVHEPEPPQRCPEHINTRKPPPCGNCADARRHHDHWSKERNERLRDAPNCRLHRGQPAHNCASCRAEELSPA